ncbi:hypothetical protein EBX31_03455 [bacterium]|nr:hypothetical protein [bacterium]
MVIVCQTAPGGKRRLAEEAFRLAAGLSATGRLQLDFVLQRGGLLLLEPEFSGPASSWESLQSPHTRVWVPSGTSRMISGISLQTLPETEAKEFTRGADLVMRF